MLVEANSRHRSVVEPVPEAEGSFVVVRGEKEIFVSHPKWIVPSGRAFECPHFVDCDANVVRVWLSSGEESFMGLREGTSGATQPGGGMF